MSTWQEFKTKFSNGTLNNNELYCNSDNIDLGLKDLKLIKYDLAIKCDSHEKALSVFTGNGYFRGYNKLSASEDGKKEDNLFYDLNISHSGWNTEDVVDEIKEELSALCDEVIAFYRQVSNINILSKKYNEGIYQDEEISKIFDEIENYGLSDQNEDARSGAGYTFGTVANIPYSSIPTYDLSEDVSSVAQDQSSNSQQTDNNKKANDTENASSVTSQDSASKIDLSTNNTSDSSSNNNTKGNIGNIGGKTISYINKIPAGISNNNQSAIGTNEGVLESENNNNKQDDLTGSLVSSINSLTKQKGLKNMIPGEDIKTLVTEKGKVLTPAMTALAASALAGMGAKLVSEKRKEQKPEQQGNKFFEYDDYQNVDEFEPEEEVVSKEALLNMLDNN